jgi:hypothetical protein
MPYNKENKKKYSATYYEAHKESIAAYYEANREEIIARQTAYYEANREEIIARRTAYRMEHPIRTMLQSAKQRAIAAGLSFCLVEADIHIPALCPVFGTPLVRGTRKNCTNSPSLDRIDSAKGYVRGNVWVISSRANTIKSDASLVELKQLVAALERRQRER